MQQRFRAGCGSFAFVASLSLFPPAEIKGGRNFSSKLVSCFSFKRLPRLPRNPRANLLISSAWSLTDHRGFNFRLWMETSRQTAIWPTMPRRREGERREELFNDFPCSRISESLKRTKYLIVKLWKFRNASEKVGELLRAFSISYRREGCVKRIVVGV